MTREEAEIYAKTMTFRDAIYNLKQARCIPYRKATFIKINELLNLIEPKQRGWKADTIIYDEFVGEYPKEEFINEDSRIIDSFDRVTSGIEQKPKTGQWIGKNKNGDWYCNKCGAILEKDEQVRHVWNYCYHCGTLML